MLSLVSHFKQRALLWTLQQFMSEGVDIKAYLRRVMLGVTAAAAAGVLVALAIAAALGGGYIYLTTQGGFDQPTALLLIALAALIPAIVLFWLASASLKGLNKFSTPAPIKAPVGVEHFTKIGGDVVNSFIEGLLTSKPRAKIVRLYKASDAELADLDRRKDFRVVNK
ncbi:MAG: hypothetical protein V4691_00245 [Pseudomonadota bacterium]